MGLLLAILLVALALGSLPRYRHSRQWGYGPSGLLTVLLVIVVLMIFLGPIPVWFDGPMRPVTVP